jgi:hypothetical protein
VNASCCTPTKIGGTIVSRPVEMAVVPSNAIQTLTERAFLWKTLFWWSQASWIVVVSAYNFWS